MASHWSIDSMHFESEYQNLGMGVVYIVILNVNIDTNKDDIQTNLEEE